MLFDIFAVSGAVVIALAGIPQLWRMYKEKSSKNVSVLMWIMLLYGLAPLWVREVFWVQNPVFIFQMSFSEVINIVAIYMILFYRDKTPGSKKERKGE